MSPSRPTRFRALSALSALSARSSARSSALSSGHSSGRWSGLIAGVMTAALAVGQALAQTELRPPKITENPSSPRVWMYAVLLLIVAAVIFAASLKPKRTHQD